MQPARLYLMFKLLLRSLLGKSRVSLALDTFDSCLKLDSQPYELGVLEIHASL
jgi:hypothetical protein